MVYPIFVHIGDLFSEHTRQHRSQLSDKMGNFKQDDTQVTDFYEKCRGCNDL